MSGIGKKEEVRQLIVSHLHDEELVSDNEGIFLIMLGNNKEVRAARES